MSLVEIRRRDGVGWYVCRLPFLEITRWEFPMWGWCHRGIDLGRYQLRLRGRRAE